MAACSLLLPNIIPSTPKALNPSPLHFPSIFSYSTAAAAAVAAALPSLRRKVRNSELSTVAKVAVSADYEQEHQSFSPGLKLFVGNLPFTVDSSELAALFQNAGNVEMVEVIYDKMTGRSRGFGFVTMSTVEDVEAASQKFNGYEFKGRSLNVNSGPPPPKEELPSRGFRSSSGGSNFGSGGSSFGRGGGSSGRGGGSVDSANRVYVGNLSWDVDNKALETLFSEQGKVMDAKVVYDRETGRSRGFGFVTYSSAQEVNKAISSLDGSDLDGRNIRVSSAEARPPRREF